MRMFGQSMVFGAVCLLVVQLAQAGHPPKCPLSAAENPIKTEDDISQENLIKIGSSAAGGKAALEPADLIMCLPKEYRDSYVMAYDSKSLQGGDKTNPRVVMYGKTGRNLIGFNPTDGEIELIQYGKKAPPKTGFEFTPKLVSVGKDGVHAGDVSICAGCHGKEFRPKFDAYDRWPGMWASSSRGGVDTITASECKDYKAFLARQAKDPNSPYKIIPMQKVADVKPSVGGGCEVKNGATTSPAGQLNHVISGLNTERVKAELKGDLGTAENRLKFNRTRYLWLSAALGCNLVQPESNHTSYFDQAIPEDLRKQAKCDDIRKEVGDALTTEFNEQVKQMNVTACRVDVPPAMVTGAGYPYFMIDNTTCGNDPVKCKAECQKVIADRKAEKPNRRQLELLKAVELPGTADFESIVSFCCAARVAGLANKDGDMSCKNWSYATRGKKTQSYSMADGLPGIRALGDMMAMDPDFTKDLEFLRPGKVEMICCKDVEQYIGANEKCTKTDPNKETCAGVRRFLHKGTAPSLNLTHNDFPYLATACNPAVDGKTVKAPDANLANYQERARACRELALKSNAALTGQNSGDYSPACVGAPYYTMPLKMDRTATALIEMPMRCPQVDAQGLQPGLPALDAPSEFPQ